MELVFRNSEGKIITPVNAGEYATLFDEQELAVDRATNMNGTYFDEIYHARTAYEMINHYYCYENTHPPLGKEIMALGIMIFGMNPFGWRFMGTLFGVFMVIVMYLFARQFFKSTKYAALTTLLFTFDFMHFVQTRIATIDVFVVLFIMLSYYFMYKYTQLSFYDTPL
jgi:predicted membrane-bound dolichyl-phosphate-mannose-protein mannosyltransferase